MKPAYRNSTRSIKGSLAESLYKQIIISRSPIIHQPTEYVSLRNLPPRDGDVSSLAFHYCYVPARKVAAQERGGK